jgi:predicted transcriptional regulator
MPISDLEFQMLYDSGPIAMRTVFRQLEQRIERLEQTVATLLVSKNKNSHNSSKPLKVAKATICPNV